MAKKHKVEEHENHERWLVSYADFITLLFAFFVVMYAAATTNARKFKQVSSALKFALAYKGTGGVDKLPIFEGTGRPKIALLEDTFTHKRKRKINPKLTMARTLILKKMNQQFGATTAKGLVAMDITDRGLVIKLSANHFFESGKANLSPVAIAILDSIADEILPFNFYISVEGHTDDRVIKTKDYETNWDLSAARSITIVRFIKEGYKYPGDHLSATSFGRYRPVGDNDTAKGRAKNRRIELVLSENFDKK